MLEHNVLIPEVKFLYYFLYKALVEKDKSWFFNKENNPFSFNWICEALNINNKEHIKNNLNNIDLSFVRYDAEDRGKKEIAHGTWQSYANGCRCNKCKKDWNKYYRNKRKKDPKAKQKLKAGKLRFMPRPLLINNV